MFSDDVTWTQADIESRVLAQEESQGGGGGVIYGFNDPTTLTAGKGAEVLIGVSGNDTYVWSAGDGPTFIDEENKQAGSEPFITVKGVVPLDLKGVAPADVTVSYDPTPGGTDLVLTMPGQSPVILQHQTGQRYFDIIDRVVFDDGTTWDASEFVLKAGGGIATTPNGTTARAFDGTPATASTRPAR